MRKKIQNNLLIFIPFYSTISFACIDLPYGEVSGFSESTVKLCKTAYTSYYDKDKKYTPNVSYILNPEHGLVCTKRTGDFKSDPEVTNSPSPFDYEDSDYDRGHLSPYLDNAWNDLVEKESFYMTNIAPQYPGLNRGVWKKLETEIRIFSYESSTPLLIYVGGIPRRLDNVIGNSKLDVPALFYKVVVDTKTKRIWAFIFPNENKLEKTLSKYQVSVKEVEDKTGFIFPVPGDKKSILPLWEIDSKRYLKNKQYKCGR